ncbi:metal ABC transporter permease [Alsobacter sp. R-9]
MSAASDIVGILLLRGGWNTVVVMLGAAALGLACGAVGVFTMLRRKALVADAVAHAALPGLVAAFLFAAAIGLPPRSPPLLLGGAALSAVLAAGLIQWLSGQRRITEDTATAAVLAATFGLGIALLSVAQTLRTGGQAGLDSFLLGSTAGMLASEAILIGALALLVIVILRLALDWLAIVAFDPVFARASGVPVVALDRLVTVLSLACVVIGLRVVGLVLVVAMLIIPPAAARFWSNRLGVVVTLSGLFGAAAAYGGAAVSAVVPNTPTGATIVVVAAALFALSMLFGPARGLLRLVGRRPERTAAQAVMAGREAVP